MSMERRTFLGTLMAGLGAMVIKPSAGLLWQPSEAAIEIVEPSAFITLDQITREMLRRITNELQVTVPLRNELSLLGQQVPDSSAVLNHQFNVTMSAPAELDRFGLDVERYIVPAAETLAHRVRGMKGCGRLPTNLGAAAYQSCVVTSPSSGLSLRGIYAWSPVENDHRLRFDMLVAQ